jgi:carboxymethylenebutenolidase
LAVEPEQLKQINAPILGIFGAQDRGISVQDVKKFEQTLKEMGKNVQVIIYPDAGHGFENPSDPQKYRAQDTADAWLYTVEFLGRTLKH